MSFSRGKSKQQQQTTPEATPQERELNVLDLELRKALQPQLIDVNKLALGLSGELLSGGQLPGFLGDLPGGISPEVTQNIVDESLEDVATSAQLGGILDSGVTQELGARTAADIRTQAEQFNIQNLLQLLNLAVGGTAQVQQPALGFGQQLSARLAGLRSEATTGRQTTTEFGASLGDVTGFLG
jgi:hypothetical protein